jgi:hypothetical protein
MNQAYTAKTYHLNLQLSQHSSNDLDTLLIQLLQQLESSYSGTRGYITHNASGKILHQCRKSMIE